MIEVLLIATQFLVIHPNGARELRDTKPEANQCPPGSQICLWDPQPGNPTDPYLYVRHHSGTAIYQAPPKVDLPPTPDWDGFLRELAEDPIVPMDLAIRLTKVFDNTKRQAVWQQVSKDLTDEAKQAILNAAKVHHMGIE